MDEWGWLYNEKIDKNEVEKLYASSCKVLFLAFSFMPDTFFFLTISWNRNTCTMLLTILPTSSIFSTVRPWEIQLDKFSQKSLPFECSLSMFFIFNVISSVFSSIFESEDAFSMHFIIDPASSIFSSIRPDINPYSFDIIIFESSFISWLICPNKLSFSMFFTCFKIALIFWPIRPNFNA